MKYLKTIFLFISSFIALIFSIVIRLNDEFTSAPTYGTDFYTDSVAFLMYINNAVVKGFSYLFFIIAFLLCFWAVYELIVLLNRNKKKSLEA